MLSSFRIWIRNILPSVTQWHFPLWKWGTKTPKTSPASARRGPHVIRKCLGPPHAPPQTAAPTVEALLHTYAVNSSLITLACPKFAPKCTPSRGPIPKPHCWCLIPGPVRPMMPKGIRIWSAIFPQCTSQTDVRMDRPTDRPRESLMTIARYASNESDAV